MCVETEAKQATTTITLTPATDKYTLASTIERIKSMYLTPVGGTRGKALEETSIEDIIDRQQGTTSSNGNYPTHYALLGVDELVVWPTPTTADTITVYYVGLPTALSASTDVPILHEPWATKLLFHGPAADLASFQGNLDKLQWHSAQAEAWEARYRQHLNRKKGTTTRQFRVASDTLFVPHDPSMDIRYGAS